MRIIDTHTRLADVTDAEWYSQRDEVLTRHASHARHDAPDDSGYSGHRDGVVDSFVHVSSTKVREMCLLEAEWVERIARRYDLDLVMVAGVDPGRSTAEVLADLDVLAASESFRGVRLPFGVAHDLPFVDGLLRWLAERSLVLELSPAAHQVPAWVRVLERYPRLVSVVGYDTWVVEPEGHVSEEWRQAFLAYAAGNVDAWQVTLPSDGRPAAVPRSIVLPWLEFAVDLLGWDRLMFASTLPLATSASQYPGLVAELDSLLSFGSADEREKFWGGNAAAAYRM